MPREQPMPPAAVDDPDSVEMLRVWIANQGLHCAIRVGMYEDEDVDETRAWGIMLSDVIRHVAQALEREQGGEERKIIAEIKNSLLEELDSPTSKVSGRFRD